MKLNQLNSNLMLINSSKTETSIAETYITVPDFDTETKVLAEELFNRLNQDMPNAKLKLTQAGCGTFIIASQVAYYCLTIQETDTEILITQITC